MKTKQLEVHLVGKENPIMFTEVTDIKKFDGNLTFWQDGDQVIIPFANVIYFRVK